MNKWNSNIKLCYASSGNTLLYTEKIFIAKYVLFHNDNSEKY